MTIARLPTVSSPCICVCVIDDGTGLCEGCGRTLGEIVNWGGMSEEARLQVMADLGRRGWAGPSASVSEAVG
ncbi:DUF1289 domain-containing protein [Aureimonas sp. ME7]|uniref:DUF1289 domain-containing protein n=1 Tax=Aureimonas sp. ME7 TaxID=2744252 RepID=UPI0015F6C3E8|nr:DUF1289 domain-containing protein [Aureimonas sp. ME7]